MGLFDILGSVAKEVGKAVKSQVEEYRGLLSKFAYESDDYLIDKVKSGRTWERPAAYKTLVDRHGKKEVKFYFQSEAMLRDLEREMKELEKEFS